jgi:hypothetical protein
VQGPRGGFSIATEPEEVGKTVTIRTARRPANTAAAAAYHQAWFWTGWRMVLMVVLLDR